MPTYKRSAVTAKEGLNFVRSAVESGGSLFIKIEQENDLGIDALIEFIQDERPLNKQVAVQIKSGASYFTPESKECAFPVGTHAEYWAKHPLPVYGIVYVPALGSAYWVNIKRFLQSETKATVVRYAATEANRLDASSFPKLFLPAATGATPTLEFADALRLSKSALGAETYLGLLVLFRRYPNRLETWDSIVNTVQTRPVEDVPAILIYWIAHIPWHGDIGYFGESLAPATRTYARELLRGFRFAEVVKLLSFIDPEGQISRGAIGQSVEAIISSLPQSKQILNQILQERSLPIALREYAAIILAINDSLAAETELLNLSQEGSWYASHVLEHIREYGSVNPYA
jgi:hypothetical protein